MNEQSQAEIDLFREKFGKYKDARVVLYGIGRSTVTLIEGLSEEEFHFVGLMDRDPGNLGKTAFGLPIIDQGTAERCADIVIINTAEIYWNVIYSRIQGIKIPVYYKNGEPAHPTEKAAASNPFQGLSNAALCAGMQCVKVVSFDFFDTLFMRSVSSPQDVFDLLNLRLKETWHSAPDFSGIRNRAQLLLRGNYSLDELYCQIEELYPMPHPFWADLKRLEMEVEQRLLVPRSEVLADLRLAIDAGKEVYIISDMYLPKAFYQNVLSTYGIDIPYGHILLSNELDAAKRDGSMWRYFCEHIVRGRPALHIGDSCAADIKIPSKYGIQAYQTPSAWDMLQASSIGDAAAQIRCTYDKAVMGCIMAKLFENPFAMEHTDGTIQIESCYEMGYCVFGPAILTFLLWMMEESKKCGITKLVFMSRDGYFLKEDFEYLCELMGIRRDCCYLGISRQLAMIVSIESQEDLVNFLSMPYTGNMVALFEDRLGLTGIEEIPGGQLEDYVKKYSREIEACISSTKENYLQYTNRLKLTEACAIVDLGYDGTIQRYLNKFLGLDMPGYYFNANFSESNPNIKKQKMSACFQDQGDPAAKSSQMRKWYLCLESFLTAPYGMIKAINQDGTFLCAAPGENQRRFADRQAINQGLKHFMRDYVERFGKWELQPNWEFSDWLYGFFMGGAMKFSEDIKAAFYMDNAMMGRGESMLFC